MIDGHGNDRYKYGLKIKHDFSSNIAFNNSSAKILDHLRDHLDVIENYPDPTASVLSQKIAHHHAVDGDSVLVCNGSAEAFYMIAHHISRNCSNAARSLIFSPSFAEYQDSCKLYNHRLYDGNLTEFSQIDYSCYDSVWLGTPNNPDGYRITSQMILEAANSAPATLFVVDRAYNDLSRSCDDLSMDATPENIIAIHSLTKTFGIPGLRLGYVLASKEVVESLKSLRPPWSVNALSLVAGEYVMDNYQDLGVDTDQLLSLSGELQAELSAIEFLSVTPSDANFFLCRITDGRSAVELQEYLINNFGILIRDASNFKSLSSSHFRVATQSAEVNSKLIEALKLWE